MEDFVRSPPPVLDQGSEATRTKAKDPIPQTFMMSGNYAGPHSNAPAPSGRLVDDDAWRCQRRLSAGMYEDDDTDDVDPVEPAHTAPLSAATKVEFTSYAPRADTDSRAFKSGITDLRAAAEKTGRPFVGFSVAGGGSSPSADRNLLTPDHLPLAFAGGFPHPAPRTASRPTSTDDDNRYFFDNPPLSMDSWDGISGLLQPTRRSQYDKRFASVGSDYSDRTPNKLPSVPPVLNPSLLENLGSQLSAEIAAIKSGGTENARQRRLYVPPGETALTVCVEKWSPSLGRGWQWRYFELQEKQEKLVYWDEEALASSKPPRGSIDLSSVSRIYADTGTSLVLRVPGRDYALRFVDPNQKDLWLDILDVAIYNAKMLPNAAAPLDPTPSPTNQPPASPPLSVASDRGKSAGVLPTWSSFIEDWVVRPLRLSNSKTERCAFTVSELAMKKSFLLEKGLLAPLKKISRHQQKKGEIIDVRRYVPNIPDEEVDALSQLAERCATNSDPQKRDPRAQYWSSILNISNGDLIPEGIPPRFRLAVAQLQLIKGEPGLSESFLDNILAGCLRFGRQIEGLSEVEMRRYFGLMICSRPIANGKAQHCRTDNLPVESVKLGNMEYKVGVMYLFDCQFDNSPPVTEIDLKTCWEIKSVKQSPRDFLWSVKEPPQKRTICFSCATYRDAVSWRMAHVMAKLSVHSEKEKSQFLRYLYNQKDKGWRPSKSSTVNTARSSRSAAHSVVDKEAESSPKWSPPADVEGKACGPTDSWSSDHRTSSLKNTAAVNEGEGDPRWKNLCLMTIPGTTIVRRRSTHSGQKAAMAIMGRHYLRPSGLHDDDEISESHPGWASSRPSEPGKGAFVDVQQRCHRRGVMNNHPCVGDDGGRLTARSNVSVDDGAIRRTLSCDALLFR